MPRGTATARTASAGLRAAHVQAVRAALEDHIARVEWPCERIDRYRTERLRALLAHARECSPFHAARMGDVDPASATVGDLARLPPMVKQQARGEWDAIVTVLASSAPAPSGSWPSSVGFPTRPRVIRCLARAARAVCVACTCGIGSYS
jgi:hypothetical protein